MNPCIHIERMLHRSSIAVAGESAAGYLLLKLIPSGSGSAARPLRLNLALVLDVSGSMYDEDGTDQSRLQRVQDAALAAIQKLRPEDTLAVIGFAQNARVLLPSKRLAEKSTIEEVLRRVGTFDVDPGGTAMDEGMALALAEIEKHAGAGTLSQMVVLTDGETSGEQNCMLAQKAADKKIRLGLMGVGLDWKSSLLKDLAGRGQGTWYYIDVNEPQQAMDIFAQEFDHLTAAAFLDVQVHLRPIKDVRIKRLRQVTPEIKEIKLAEGEERNLQAALGVLPHDASSRYVLELSLPKRPDGKYCVAQLELSYRLGSGQRLSSGPIPLEVSYTAAGHGHANGEVMKYIDEIQLKEMSDVLHRALEADDQQTVQQVALEMVKKGEQMGPAGARKTQLAMKVVQELSTNGVVSRKTQLALDDAARTSETPS